ncbi:MAG TPA: helix-turn-helix domain-containing protein [Propionibacteriaceae bacterium]|nr:helix-turn-helix domain-containing protein [Propionibacteriaceae bacterium]
MLATPGAAIPSPAGDRESLADELVKRYDNGESVQRLADELGRDYTSVYRILRARGVQFRHRGGKRGGKPRRRPPPPLALDHYELTMVLEGLTLLSARSPAVRPTIAALAAKVSAARDDDPR